MRSGWLGILCAVCCVSLGGRAAELPLTVGATEAATTLAAPEVGFDVAAAFEGADTNNDELVTFEEAHAYSFLVTQVQFDSYDINRDGCIDRAEAGLPPVDPVDPGPTDGCNGCGGGNKSWPAGGDLFTMALSLLGLAAMAKVGRP